MANVFSRKISRNIGTSLTAVGSYTVGGGVVTTVIGLSVCNTTTSPITVDVTSTTARTTPIWLRALVCRWVTASSRSAATRRSS